MKKLLIILSLGLIGCGNETPAIEWVKEAKKPIICDYTGSNALGFSIYTLIDADGNMYVTGYVTMSFPDTIKSTLTN